MRGGGRARGPTRISLYQHLMAQNLM
jgi:hypothetical protein